MLGSGSRRARPGSRTSASIVNQARIAAEDRRDRGQRASPCGSRRSSPPGRRSASPVRPATSGRTATASRPATRETALLIPGGDPGVAGVGGGEDGRGDRRDDQRQAEPEDDHRRQDRGRRSCRPGRSCVISSMPGGDHQRADRERDPRRRSAGRARRSGPRTAASAAVTGSEAAPAAIGE